MTRTDIVVPSYGMTDNDSYVQSWLVEPGATVEAGSALLVLETAKAETEIEAPVAGIVGDILVPAESEVPPGTVLTWIDGAQ
jgi:pyruvate/2-oxoglutarate dehydrogenase complex dihydrolipoamide acyltransferase (E2) component